MLGYVTRILYNNWPSIGEQGGLDEDIETACVYKVCCYDVIVGGSVVMMQ